jgi:hypothetical protein
MESFNSKMVEIWSNALDLATMHLEVYLPALNDRKRTISEKLKKSIDNLVGSTLKPSKKYADNGKGLSVKERSQIYDKISYLEKTYTQYKDLLKEVGTF